ncbi:MAG: diacylglycerol kinase family protein [Erysipelotrichia bacterium]|nr:diacylglycerol kinase family protein [Erysipelotrichia bacterium]NCC54368.1 diacylglycerol kinase family protein [Erysipelotrichia bacterium]
MKSLKNKFANAINGLISSFRDRSILIQCCFMLCAMIAGMIFHLTLIEWCFILFCCGLVIICEMINSCIEKIMDFICPEYDERVKVIKDMAAGFVMLASIFALIIGILIFGGKL